MLRRNISCSETQRSAPETWIKSKTFKIQKRQRGHTHTHEYSHTRRKILALKHWCPSNQRRERRKQLGFFFGFSPFLGSVISGDIIWTSEDLPDLDNKRTGSTHFGKFYSAFWCEAVHTQSRWQSRALEVNRCGRSFFFFLTHYSRATIILDIHVFFPRRSDAQMAKSWLRCRWSGHSFSNKDAKCFVITAYADTGNSLWCCCLSTRTLFSTEPLAPRMHCSRHPMDSCCFY